MAFHPTDINGILTPFLLLTNARWLQEIIDDTSYFESFRTSRDPGAAVAGRRDMQELSVAADGQVAVGDTRLDRAQFVWQRVRSALVDARTSRRGC